MSEKDFAISVTGAPNVGHISKKPCYLISLDGSGKKGITYFISIDKPDLLNNFIQVKGIYSDFCEDEITKRFSEIILNTPKESIVDMMFPSHRIFSIKSLVFNANKPSTLIK
jgi:hypothetical protein